jgi:hypothetical protein
MATCKRYAVVRKFPPPLRGKVIGPEPYPRIPPVVIIYERANRPIPKEPIIGGIAPELAELGLAL